jgi:gas vesicle protein
MNDRTQDRPDTGMVAPLVGFALGAVVGGVIALLLAPASGEKTRRKLGNAARRMGRDARQTFDDAREAAADAASEMGSGVKAAVVAGREMFQKDGGR